MTREKIYESNINLNMLVKPEQHNYLIDLFLKPSRKNFSDSFVLLGVSTQTLRLVYSRDEFLVHGEAK